MLHYLEWTDSWYSYGWMNNIDKWMSEPHFMKIVLKKAKSNEIWQDQVLYCFDEFRPRERNAWAIHCQIKM